jgi:hypothetical protein
LAGETEVPGKNIPQRHFCPLQNRTRSYPGLNPRRRGGKPATNRLRYGAASANEYLCRKKKSRLQIRLVHQFLARVPLERFNFSVSVGQGVFYLFFYWFSGGAEYNWVHSVLRPPIALLCQSRVIMMENWWNDNRQRKPSTRRKPLSTTNPTCSAWTRTRAAAV